MATLTIRAVPALLAFLLGAAAYGQTEPERVHARLYAKVAPSVVYLEGGQQKGSGVIIDKTGIVLTSPTACGLRNETVTVMGKGNRQYLGIVMGRVLDKELALVKIDTNEEFPALELEDSDTAQLGQVSYVFGDSFDSILNDDQPAISLGVISGRYEVKKAQKGTYYTGPVIETSAAVNPNQDGGPLVNRHGRVVGIVTLNYVDSKFTGMAIPVNELKDDIRRIRREYETGVQVRKAGEAWLGVEVRAVKGGLQVTRVARKGPADRGGVRKGDVILRIGSVRVLATAALKQAVSRMNPGDAAELTVLRADGEKKLKVTLSRRRLY